MYIQTLRFYIDLEDDIPFVTSWTKIYESINDKTSSLVRLRLEHQFEIPDIQLVSADTTQNAFLNSVVTNYGKLYMNFD